MNTPHAYIQWRGRLTLDPIQRAAPHSTALAIHAWHIDGIDMLPVMAAWLAEPGRSPVQDMQIGPLQYAGPVAIQLTEGWVATHTDRLMVMDIDIWENLRFLRGSIVTIMLIDVQA